MRRAQSDTEAVVQRLEEATPFIEKIRAISGNAGISLGVLHHGETIYRANFGFRDVASGLPPDSDTVFPIASMTKAMVASSFAALVDEGKIGWETKLSELVPEFKTLNENIKAPELVTEANLMDLLTHRLGLTQGNNFWSQKDQQVLIDKSETAKIVGSLQPLAPFRSKFMYLNWGYGLAGEILENVTGEGLEEHFQRTLFKPLGLSRTTMAVPDANDYVKCYMALSNATPWEVRATAYVAGKARAGAGACKSTVNDLLILYKAWMEAAADQEQVGRTSTPGSPFKCVGDTWTSRAAINDETGYGLGWAMTQLPCKAGLLGVNGYECPELPTIAKGIEPQPMVYHQGSVSGALSAIYMLPKTRSAIVVLGNSFDLTDTPDWISQVLLEALFDAPERTDFIDLAKKTVANALSHHPPTVEQLAREQQKGTKARPLEEYCGRYYNQMGNFYLEISQHEDGLRMAPQGFNNVSYYLYHYNYDVFAWPVDRDADSKQALYPQHAIGLHKISFLPGSSGQITKCNWQIDKAIPEGEIFTKQRAGLL